LPRLSGVCPRGQTEGAGFGGAEGPHVPVAFMVYPGGQGAFGGAEGLHVPVACIVYPGGQGAFGGAEGPQVPVAFMVYPGGQADFGDFPGVAAGAALTSKSGVRSAPPRHLAKARRAKEAIWRPPAIPHRAPSV
jgi:hypothetical protein